MAEIVDLRCSAGTCAWSGAGAYVVNGHCTNCGWLGVIVVSKRHQRPWNATCPRCEFRALNGDEFVRELANHDEGDQYIAEMAGASPRLKPRGRPTVADLNLHESMIERGVKALAATDDDYRYVSDADMRDAVEKVIRAAFDGVPLNNYSIGTLLADFDLVILVKEHPHSAAALVARREGDRPVSEGFETSGHTLTVNWGDKPTRYIKSVTVGKLDPPQAPAVASREQEQADA